MSALPNTKCPVCGTLYNRAPSEIKANKRQTCSRTCAARHFRDKGTTEPCKCCGKPMYRRASLAKREMAIYCSRACEVKSRPNQPIACTCGQCGKTFQKEWYAVNKQGGGKFCSRTCIDAFKRKLRKRGEQEIFTNWQKREWKADKCAKCGKEDRLELDHILPRFAGGKATKENSQTLCRTCNRKKFWDEDYPLYEVLLTTRQAEAA